MWITLFVMAVAISLEPFRLSLSVLMLNRPRPVLQLAALLGGGFLMGLSVGASVLFVVESRLPRSTHFQLPKVQIVIGALALLAAGIVAATQAPPRRPPAWFTRLLEGQSLWVGGIAGLGTALPSVDYLAALAVIAAANVSAETELSALLFYNLVAFAAVEIPLLALLVAPDRTNSVMTALHRRILAHRRYGIAATLAVVGIVLLSVGLLGLDHPATQRGL